MPTGAVGATGCTGSTLPSRGQRTSRDELSTNEVIVFGPAGNVADLAGDDTVSVASSAIAEVASSADLAEVASSADLAGDVTISVPSSADLASVVNTGVAFKEECRDSIVIPSDNGGDCNDFAEVVSLAEHAGGITVDVAPPAEYHISGTMASEDHWPEWCQFPKSAGGSVERTESIVTLDSPGWLCWTWCCPGCDRLAGT